MALGSGLAAQIGYGDETVYGTAVTVDTFIPLVSESIDHQIERMESEGIIAGARVLRSEQWAAGNETIEGDVQHELYQQNMGLLFKHMLGGVATSGVGPYTHEFTPGDLSGKGLTLQIGVPQVGGTVTPLGYAGVKVASWELALEAGQIATLGLSVVGQSDVSATLATASYVTGGATPFVFTHGTVNIAAVAASVRSISLSGDNGLDTDRRNIGDANLDQPLEAELRTYDGQITIEFSATTEYDRFLNGNEFALQLVLSAGASAQVTIDANVRYDGKTPNVGGKDLVVTDVPFKVIGTTTDALGLTVTLINSQATV